MWTNIRHWLAPPYFAGDEEKSRAASLLNLILWTFILAALIEPEMRFLRAGVTLP
jgi:hypothetical protein